MSRNNALRARRAQQQILNDCPVPPPVDDGSSCSTSSSTDARRAANLQFAHNVELNRQCVNQTWQRIERAAWRGVSRPTVPLMRFDDEPPASQDGAFSSELYFRGRGRGGPRRPH